MEPDELAVFLARCDQERAGVRELGRMTAAFFNQLLEGDLSRDEAVYLTREWLRRYLAALTATSEPGDDD